MNAAKASARQKGPAVQRSSAFTAALAAEREGGRLQDAKRTGEAAEKFYEAAGLFRSAELTPGAPPPGREPAAGEPPRADASRPEPAPPPVSQAPAGACRRSRPLPRRRPRSRSRRRLKRRCRLRLPPFQVRRSRR